MLSSLNQYWLIIAVCDNGQPIVIAAEHGDCIHPGCFQPFWVHNVVATRDDMGAGRVFVAAIGAIKKDD